jgi:hypothetical protein
MDEHHHRGGSVLLVDAPKGEVLELVRITTWPLCYLSEVLSLEILDLEEAAFLPTQSYEAMRAP